MESFCSKYQFKFFLKKFNKKYKQILRKGTQIAFWTCKHEFDKIFEKKNISFTKTLQKIWFGISKRNKAESIINLKQSNIACSYQITC